MSYPWGPSGVPTSARVDFTTGDNETFRDAIQFDPPGPSGSCGCTGPTGDNWGFTGQNFRMDIKGNRGQTGPLLSMVGPTGGSSLFQIQDPVNRIFNFNVPEAVLLGTATATGCTGPGLIPGKYVYDFLMFDVSKPPIRVQLMHGNFELKHGISGG